MQISQTKKEPLKFSCTVTLTAEEIDAKVNDRLAELGKTVKMPGFRPGKVPMTMLKSKYGKSVMGEVLELAVNETSMKALNENSLRPAMRPKIEIKTFDEGQGLEYALEVELLPEIELKDISGLQITRMTAKPDAKTIKDTLAKIAQSNKGSEKVEEDRAAKQGDIVVIDFDGTVNGEAFPGMKGNDVSLELGSKSFVGTFEDQLVGTRAGDKKTVKVTFPDDYGHEKLQGVEAVFEVEVKELRTPVTPNLDDDFAKTLGFESLAKVEDALREQIQSEYDQLSRMTVKREVLDRLDELHGFEVPEGMVRAEFINIWHQMNPNKPHNHDADDHSFDTLEENEEYTAIAERRVRLGLVLAEIGRENKVQVTQQELQQAVISEARRYPGQEKQVFEFYQKNPQALDALKAPIYEDKVIDFILERAKIETREVDIDELTKAAEQEPEEKGAGAKAKKKAASKK